MSLEYIRKYYKVPAKRGMTVECNGVRGKITKDYEPYLRVKFGDGSYMTCNPRWKMRYFDKDGKLICDTEAEDAIKNPCNECGNKLKEICAPADGQMHCEFSPSRFF